EPGIAVKASRKLVARFDDKNGGFGDRPKFPSPTSLEVLLLSGETARAKHALEAMRAGGTWDHLGGGFHRYSTDEQWLVPHFEKMLYDNALLATLYLQAYQTIPDPYYRRIGTETLDFALRELRDPGLLPHPSTSGQPAGGGGFWST